MIILLEPDHTVQCVLFVCSQAESPVSFCKPVRAVTDGIMLQSSVWNGLIGSRNCLEDCLGAYTPTLSSPRPKWMSFPFTWTRIRNQEMRSQRMQHLSHLGMCRKGIFSELLFHFFQLLPLFEGYLTNLLLDFLTWHIVYSTPFKKKSFWIYVYHTLSSPL